MSAIERFCAAAAPRHVADGEAPAHFRQQHRARRDADHAERQLVEALGVIHRRVRVVGQQRREDRVGEDGDLLAGRADHRRSERGEELLHVGIEARNGEPFEHAAPARFRHQQRELGDSGDEHAPAGRLAGVGKEEGEGEESRHEQIEQHRREGGGAEIAVRIERAAVQRRQRDEGEIGEGDARHADGERELLRVLGKARRDQRDELVGVDERGDEQHDLRDAAAG